MGFEDLTKKATDFLNTDQGEQVSDKALDGAADLARKLSDGKFGDQIDGARNAADGAIGNNS